MCGDCGTKFTDGRWKAGTAVEWGRGDSHPYLCDDCKARALEASQNRPAQPAAAGRRGLWLTGPLAGAAASPVR
ncbi:hypothetical protein SGFS_104360 [Streptomyces graminofaciens]|uniref:Small CPxCG-related zinc finger protein n=1 Tax=Streptomyces graminofaciens TaxID=68212 RepID=A0ABM7FSL6_9ACTN|nr:hypothetical protein SGFS_104360 [Streptomyces graminofaciens]